MSRLANNSLVSVIIPAYNVENYILECLESILKQTYKNIECIVVDDGSTDKTSLLIKQFIKQYNLSDCYKLYSQVNSGQSIARNRGIELSNGKYICFLDSDDFLDQNAIEKLVNFSKKNLLNVVRFNAINYTDGNSFNNKLSKNKTNELIDKKERHEKVFSNNEFIKNISFRAAICLYFFRADFIKNNNLKFYHNIIHEDELFIAKSICLAPKIGFLPDILFYRRIRNNSIMTDLNNKKSIESLSVIINELEKLKSENKYIDYLYFIKDRQLKLLLSKNSKNSSTFAMTRYDAKKYSLKLTYSKLLFFKIKKIIKKIIF